MGASTPALYFLVLIRVVLDRLSAFVSTASATSCTFLRNGSDPPRDVEEEVLSELLAGEQVQRYHVLNWTANAMTRISLGALMVPTTPHRSPRRSSKRPVPPWEMGKVGLKRPLVLVTTWP